MMTSIKCAAVTEAAAHPMTYILKRILMLLLTMVIVSFLAFAAFEMIAGDPVDSMLGTEATEEQCEELREALGLNRSFPVRYFSWLIGFFTGDLGVSYIYHTSVQELILPKLGVTMTLSLISFLMILLISIPFGLLSVRKMEGPADAAWSTGIQLMMSVPPFFTGILLTWVFSIVLGWFDHGRFPGLGEDFWGSLRYLVYPAIAIAVPRIASTVRMLRSTVRDELQKDYVRTAISRGNSRSRAIRSHVLKNAMVPVVTFLAQTMAEILAATVLVEQVFAIPGLGRFMVASINHRDFPVVQAIVVILAFWVVLAGTLADIVNQRIDPRLRLEGNP